MSTTNEPTGRQPMALPALTQPLRIVLLDERPESANLNYAGRHWSERNKEANRVHWLVRGCMPAHVLESRPFQVPVHIRVIAYLADSAIDPDNIQKKYYIDGLKGLVIVDDNPTYVRSVTTEVQFDRQCPRLVIAIDPVKDDE